MSQALDLLHAVVTDSGKRWGEIAADFQREDAAAIFSPERPNLHFLTRPRGGSKTSDLAGAALSWLAVEAPPRARGYVIASNADQAALLIDAAAGIITRTPELDGYLTVEAERIIAPNGATVRVLPASDSGAWGLLNCHLIVCDEFAQWPETRGARRVWSAVRSTIQKVPGCRLVLLTSAGEPSHWSYAILRQAYADPTNWRVHEVPGPVPWQSAEDIAALERELLPSEFERLILNRWAEAEDRAIAPEDYEQAAMPATRWGDAPAGVRGGGHRLHHPRKGTSYIVTVDIGTKNDSTVIVVAHAEAVSDERYSPKRVVVDHLDRWTGSKRRHVQLEDVEARVAELAKEYHGAPVHADPDQFVGSLQRLNRLGLHASEFNFTSTSVSQIAVSLVQAFRSGLVEVPDTPELRNELLRVRLRSTAPGVTRLDTAGRADHDDQAVTIALACFLLVGKTGFTSRQFIDAVTAARTPEARQQARERRLQRAADRGFSGARIGIQGDRGVRNIVRSGPNFAPDTRTCPHGKTGAQRCLACAS
ncbi:MAG: hypothetical protein M0004_12670 [Actinomycetota bacterium]|nr:hypothetical protein [Actinomycetota bacterium]